MDSLQDKLFNKKIFNYVNPIIVGIDPSLKNTAVVVRGGKISPGEYKLETEKGKRLHEYDLRERVESISTKLQILLGIVQAENVKNVDGNVSELSEIVVIIEDYAYSRGGKNKKGERSSAGRVFDLAEVGGAIKHVLFEHSINFIIVAPTRLKKFVTGNGRALKTDMIRVLKTELGTTDDNIADAFGLCEIGMCLFNRNLIKNSIQKKIISDIRKKLEE